MASETRNEMPNKPGYYWAKWRIASDDTPEGDELTPCDDWEIVQINENGGEGLTEYSVSIPGVAVVQWRDCFIWGSFVAPLKDPALTAAAPDVLRALRPFVKEAQRLGLSSLRPDDERLTVTVNAGDIRAALAAIAKATS
jgi:hypothetical protein